MKRGSCSDTFECIGPPEFHEQRDIGNYAINGDGIVLVAGMALEGNKSWLSVVRGICDRLEAECAVGDEDDQYVRDVLPQILASVARQNNSTMSK